MIWNWISIGTSIWKTLCSSRRRKHFNNRITNAMFVYGQTSANAIAVMSYLAAEPKQRAGSGEIAKARNISRALTAKLLTQLAAAKLVSGQPGPGGGYMLAKSSKDISLM